jgi:hypothetical protein
MGFFDRFKDGFPDLFGDRGKVHLPPAPINRQKTIGADDLPSTWVTSNAYWNPNLETGTSKQGQYWDLHEALRDPQSSSCLDLRTTIAASLPWELIAQDGTSNKAMDLCRHVLEDLLDFPGLLTDLTKSTYYGLAAQEVFWKVSDDPRFKGLIVPWDTLPLDLQFVWFSQDRTVLVNGRTPETGKLLLHTTGSHFRNPYGLGRGRTVPQWVKVKKAISYLLFRDVGSYIHDKIHFTYPDGTDEAEAAVYLQNAAKAVQAPALVTREGFKATPIRLDSKFEVISHLIDAIDGQIAKAILGNTLTTGEGRHGTQALGGVHESMSDKQTWADGLRNQMTCNRFLLPWIIQANLPGDRAPQISFDTTVKQDDLKRVQALLGVASFADKDGKTLEVSGDWLRDTFNIPEPDGKADGFRLPAAVPPPPAAPKGPGLGPLHPPEPSMLSSRMDPDVRHVQEIQDRWGGQWRSRVAGLHRMVFSAMGDGQ